MVGYRLGNDLSKGWVRAGQGLGKGLDKNLDKG